MSDRQQRRHDRKSFDRMAALDVGDGTASTACEIIDISHGGARLRPLMCAPKALPEKFTLILSACGKVRRNCQVIWRSTAEVGVQFPKV
jgi:hypothetical protein